MSDIYWSMKKVRLQRKIGDYKTNLENINDQYNLMYGRARELEFSIDGLSEDADGVKNVKLEIKRIKEAAERLNRRRTALKDMIDRAKEELAEAEDNYKQAANR